MPEVEIDWYATELAILRSIIKAYDEYEETKVKNTEDDAAS